MPTRNHLRRILLEGLALVRRPGRRIGARLGRWWHLAGLALFLLPWLPLRLAKMRPLGRRGLILLGLTLVYLVVATILDILIERDVLTIDELRERAKELDLLDGLEDGMLHAKVVLIDDTVAVAGSANMDIRSLLLNYEVGLCIYDTEIIGDPAVL